MDLDELNKDYLPLYDEGMDRGAECPPEEVVDEKESEHMYKDRSEIEIKTETNRSGESHDANHAPHAPLKREADIENVPAMQKKRARMGDQVTNPASQAGTNRDHGDDEMETDQEIAMNDPDGNDRRDNDNSQGTEHDSLAGSNGTTGTTLCEGTPPQSLDADEIFNRMQIVSFNFSVWPEDPPNLFEPEELPDPCRSETPEAGTRRWRFHGHPPNKEETKRAKFAIWKQLYDSSAALAVSNMEVVLLQIEKAHYAEVVFDNQAAFIDAGKLKLQWKGRPCELALSVAALPPNQTVIKFQKLPSNTHFPDLFSTLEHNIGKYVEFKQCWASYNGYKWRHGSPYPGAESLLPTTAFTGTFQIWAQYKKNYGPDNLPGYINYRSRDLHMHFIGRGDRCSFCRTSARPMHSFAQCRWKICYACQTKGHVQEDCPTKNKGPQKFSAPTKRVL